SLSVLAEGFGFEVKPEMRIIPEEDLGEAFERMVQILQTAKAEGQVILDITPARKSLASVAMRAAEAEGVSCILYLYLKDKVHGDRPYPVVPSTMYRSHDLGTMRP
ncbi:MAG: hypothetical protein ACE5IJ_12135, partial [Thermoplasmata archaeon]